MDDTLYQNDKNSENTAFLKLPDFYTKNGYQYYLSKREGDVAIFRQQDDGFLVAYEVFEIKKQKETDWGEVHYEAKERVPSNEEWGNNAYTVWTLDQAEMKMRQIQQSIQERKKNKKW